MPNSRTLPAKKKVLELSERYGMKVDPDAKVEDISVGMQQRVEILKVLYRGAETLILDEPTASLTPQEIEGLMEIISNLTADELPFSAFLSLITVPSSVRVNISRPSRWLMWMKTRWQP